MYLENHVIIEGHMNPFENVQYMAVAVGHISYVFSLEGYGTDNGPAATQPHAVAAPDPLPKQESPLILKKQESHPLTLANKKVIR